MRFLKASRNLSLFASIACMLSVAFLGGSTRSLAQPSQVSVPVPRIVEPVNESRLTKLTGNVSAALRSAVDQGELSSSTQLNRMVLVLSRSAAQQEALDEYKAELQSKSSPNYHKWLTPEQFGKLYGPADSDIAVIVAWLQSRGLTVDEVSTGRTYIAFSGMVGQVEAAFRTSIHSFQGRDQQFSSNISDPSIPSALATVVAGVAHLDTIRPRAHHVGGRIGTFDSESRRLTAVKGFQAKSVSPNLTGSDGNLYIVPGDAATIYDTPNSFNTHVGTGTKYTGAGVIIGVAGDAAIQAATVVDYRTRFLGDTSASKIVITNIDGVLANGDTDEAYIDTELAGGLAPGATVHFYTANSLFNAIEKAISDNTVDILSVSFGACELDFTNADNAEVNSDWEQATTQGIAVTVSTGDNGSAACDATSDAQGNNIPTAVGGLAVNTLASTPNNIAVGGTDFYPLINSFSTYVSSTSNSSNFYTTALSFIPESTWNDSTQIDTTISANVPFTGADANIVAGSGGKSSCSTNTTTANVLGTCTSGYAKPSWQRGPGVPADGVRDLPDISLMAGNGADAATWLICTDDTGGNGSGVTVTANCKTQSDNNFYFQGFGGTSTAAPAFAGILALVQQKTGSRLGQAAKDLYDLYNSSHATAVFHDVTVGNNSVACTNGSPNCAKNGTNNFFESGYDTTANYDLATGIGSVDVTQLINFWGSAIGSGASTVTVTVPPGSITTAQSLAVTITVAGALGTPTGTVTLSSGSYTSAATTLSGTGAVTITIPAGQLAAGTDTLTATYSGDTNYASKTGTTTVTVTTPPAPVVALNPTSLTFTSTAVGTASAPQMVTVSNTGNATLNISAHSITGGGAAAFQATTTCGATLAAGSSCTFSITYQPTVATAVTASLTLTDDAAGSPQTVGLSGSVPAPVATLNPTSLTFAKTQVGVAATGQTITVTNTGNANLSVTSVALAETDSVSGSSGSFTSTNTCTAPVIPNGTCVITVGFMPTAIGALTSKVTITDNASNSPQTVNITGMAITAGSYTASATNVTVTKGATTGNVSTLTATGAGGYQGAIALTCSVSAITGGTHKPGCSVTGSPINLTPTTTSGTATVTLSTTAAASNAVRGRIRAGLIGKGRTGLGLAFACLLLVAIPARRRSWKSILGVLVVMAGLGVLSGCGGGSSTPPPPPPPADPGTTSGTYTVTITENDNVLAVQTTTFTLTVQ